MKTLTKVKDFINDDNNKIIIFDNNVYISNYNDIKSFDSNKFILEVKNKKIILNGKNITIKKLTKEEILIGGDIDNIEFR